MLDRLGFWSRNFHIVYLGYVDVFFAKKKRSIFMCKLIENLIDDKK